MSLKSLIEEDNEISSRMGFCETCSTNMGKYRCPGCSFVSCSVSCVASHKRVLKCDGIRNKSKFIPMTEFSEMDLLNDYQFLESAARCTESTARDKLKRYTRKGENSMELPMHLLKLRKACTLRGCKLLYLPPHFDRHRSNTSRINFKTYEINWKIEIFFVHAQQNVVLEMVDEKTPLSDLLQPYLEDTRIELDDRNCDKRTDDPILLDPYQIYRSKGFSNVNVLLKAEGILKKPRRFYSLDVTKSVVWNLQNKVIVENPIIYVVFADHADYFSNDFDSGEEDLEEFLFKEANQTKPYHRSQDLQPRKRSAVAEGSFKHQKKVSPNSNFIAKELGVANEKPDLKQKSNLENPTAHLTLVQYSGSEDESS